MKVEYADFLSFHGNVIKIFVPNFNFLLDFLSCVEPFITKSLRNDEKRFVTIWKLCNFALVSSSRLQEILPNPIGRINACVTLGYLYSEYLLANEFLIEKKNPKQLLPNIAKCLNHVNIFA